VRRKAANHPQCSQHRRRLDAITLSTSPDTSTRQGIRPRRSVLYMPGANARAQHKATQLDCDGLIFDLEDAVAADSKVAARGLVVEALGTHDYGHRERIVRVNGLSTPWGKDDIAALQAAPFDAVLFPKVESAAMVNAAAESLTELVSTAQHLVQLWVMIETPRSIVALEEICAALLQANETLVASATQASPGVLVMGTSDLVQDLRAQHTVGREPLIYALTKAVTVARAFGLDILDGVHLDFRNLQTFRHSCEQGRAMGFDGRSLIHPGQIEMANELYGVAENEVEHAQRVLRVWNEAQGSGLGVVELDGQLIENLHAAEAQRVLAMAAAAQRGADEQPATFD